jgi:PAS domain S-box-containing protein
MNISVPDFKAIFHCLPGNYLILLPDSPKFTIMDFNDCHSPIGFINLDNCIGKSVFEVFTGLEGNSSALIASLADSLQKVVDEEIEDKMEIRTIHTADNKNQESYNYMAINIPVIINGKVTYIIHHVIDVTELIKAERYYKAPKLDQYSHDLFMQMPFPVYILKGSNYILELANEPLLKLWNKKEDIIGKPILSIFPENENKEFIQILDYIKSEGKPFYANEKHDVSIAKSIEGFANDFIYMPYFEADGSISGVLALAMEITGKARQKAEDIIDELNFRNTLLEVRTEATPDGVLVVDAKGTVISMNQKFAEIWGLSQEVVDSKDDNLALQHAMTRLVNPQAFIERVRFLYDHPNERDHEVMHFKDGRMIERYGLPVLGKDGKYYGWVWYIRDITEQINQLLAVEKVRQKVARDLHDDVGSTLTSIGLLSELAKVKADLNIKEAKQLIEKIGDNSNRMMEAMADIVWSINPNNDSMQKIIVRMREFAIMLLEGKNIRFNFHIDESVEGLELNIEVRLDFFLIFKESINNLIKYSKADFVDINIIYQENHLILTIKDNGVGFDMQNHRQGNGLQNIVKRAKDIKGHIDIISEPGKGTSIYLSVPV